MQLFNDAKICLAVCSDLGNNRNSNKRIHQQHSKIRYQECKIPWSSFASFLCLWMVSSNDDSSSSSAMFAEIAEIVLHNVLHQISKNRRSTWVKTQFITRSPAHLTSHQRRENVVGSYFSIDYRVHVRTDKNCKAGCVSSRLAGYWEKFSISNNRASGEPHWLR